MNICDFNLKLRFYDLQEIKCETPFEKQSGFNIKIFLILNKAEDLLLKVSNETNQSGEIVQNTQNTKFYDIPESIKDFVINVNVLGEIHSIKIPFLKYITEFLRIKNEDILKPDNSNLKRGNAYIIIIANSQSELNRNDNNKLHKIKISPEKEKTLTESREQKIELIPKNSKFLGIEKEIEPSKEDKNFV